MINNIEPTAAIPNHKRREDQQQRSKKKKFSDTFEFEHELDRRRGSIVIATVH